MADGEKKRFGNFAEYAKARQAGKVVGGDTFQISQDQIANMSGQGASDQARFMQGGQGQLGQLGLMSAGLQQQLQQQALQPGLQQGLQQQRGIGAPGMGGLGMVGMPLNRSQASGAFPSGGQGMMGQQRMPQMQGGGGGGLLVQGGGGSIGQLGMSRAGLGLPGGGGGGQPGYNPSGEILAMLGKGGAGGGGAGLNGALGQHQAASMRPFAGGGYESSLESSDFPSLGRSNSQNAGSDGGSLASPADFSLEDEFPALPGSSGGPGANNMLMSSGSGGPGMSEQFQRMKLDNVRDVSRLHAAGGLSSPAGGAAGAAGAGGAAAGDVAAARDASVGQQGRDKPDRFGMMGLLNVIRMVDENLNMLALGTDLTHLGLDLNATGNLWETFESPWIDPRSQRTPDYTVPQCYLIPPPPLKTVFFSKFKDATLFYIFYYFLASRAPHQELRKTLVECASKELVNRGWEYRCLGGPDSTVWMIRLPGTNEVKYFDHHTMELRGLPVQPAGPAQAAAAQPAQPAQLTDPH